MKFEKSELEEAEKLFYDNCKNASLVLAGNLSVDLSKKELQD